MSCAFAMAIAVSKELDCVLVNDQLGERSKSSYICWGSRTLDIAVLMSCFHRAFCCCCSTVKDGKSERSRKAFSHASILSPWSLTA